MQRKTAKDFDQELLNLFDRYVHGLIDRRSFFKEASKYAVGGLTVAAILDGLSPNYALAVQVPPEDPEIVATYESYESPQGYGAARGYLVKPASLVSAPGVLVVHENRGLNPYVEDVARRLAKAGFVAFAPDALTSLGGYPGSDDAGREMQSRLERSKIAEDFKAGARHLQTVHGCNGKVGVVGFCFGGWMANHLATELPDIVQAAVPYYGGQAPADAVPRIEASLQLHYGGLDDRVNAGWPAYEEALKSHGVAYEVHFYEGANHGFHNDTTPRYDQPAAELAWSRTIAFFRDVLGS